MNTDPAVTVAFFASCLLLLCAAGAYLEWRLDRRRRSRQLRRRISRYGKQRRIGL